MLREQLNAIMKDAMRAKDTRRLSTVRLILAAVKDRDIAVRTEGRDKIDDQMIADLLARMIKQRHDSIAAYEQGGRPDLAEQEKEEIKIIQEFLPPQMEDAEITAAAENAVAEAEATGLKDIGRVMSLLKERYAGRMDFAKASAAVRQRLS